VPKLWSQTIDTHRLAVREAILETAVALVEKRGLRAVTMSEIAEGAGIGRATLYKYFASVEEILLAWHERQVSGHFEELAALAHGPGSPDERLRSVLAAFAAVNHEQLGNELAVLLHEGKHVAKAREHLQHLLRNLLEQGAKKRLFRTDVPAAELAAYCLHALTATATLHAPKAVERLLDVILAGLRHEASRGQRRAKHT
jgi:AcrR family transcriptional regulator